MTLGIFCPGSPPRREAFEAGLAWLASQGIRFKLGATIVPGDGLHAGAPEERARDLHALYLDPEVDAILCARGGSGTLGILPHLDLGIVAESAKPLIGMSDVTALHLALYKSIQRTGISAPMVVQLSSELPDYTVARWIALVQGAIAPGAVELPPETTLEGLAGKGRRREAEGALLPCNLALLAALLGTPYLPSLAGAILVLEDIHETPQSLDRMVTQLKLSGCLEGLAGIVLGQFTECVPRGEGVTEEDGQALLRDWAGSLGIPALFGFPYGHDPACCALPFGTRARITAEPAGLELVEDVGR